MFLELWSGFFEMWYLSFWNVILVLWNVISVFVFKYGTCFFKCVIVLFLKCDTFFGNVVHFLRCDTAFFSWKLGRIQNLRNVSRNRFKHKIKVPFNKRSVTLTNLRRLLCSVRRIPGLVFAVADAHRDGTHTEEQVESIYEGIRQDD